MAEQKIRYKYVTKEALEELNNVGLTYQEMADCFEIEYSSEWIKKLFHRFGIKKKSRASMMFDEFDKNPNISPFKLMDKYDVTEPYVYEVRREWRKLNDKNNN